MTADLRRPRRHGRHGRPAHRGRTSRSERRPDQRAVEPRPRAGSRRRRRRGRRRDRACSSCRASSTSTRTRASPATPSPTASSRTPWRPRSAARRRSWRSTTRAPGHRRRPQRTLPDGHRASGGPRPRAIRAVDVGLAAVIIAAQRRTPIADMPRPSTAGVADVQGVHGLRLRRGRRTLLALLGAAARAGGMLQVHCEDRADARRAASPASSAAGETGPALPCRVAAAVRRGRGDAAGRSRWREAADAPALRRPRLVARRRCARSRAARAAGRPVFAETCPHYLTLDESRYELPPEEAATLRHLAAAPPAGRPRRALGRRSATARWTLVATDHVPDRRRRREAELAGESFDRISNGAPGIETLLAIV